MRAGDIDQGGETWVYTPARHKAEHHDKPREVLVGPRGQEVLRPWLKADPGAYLFSPAEATLERREAMRGRRQTRVQPSQADQSKSRPKKVPGACYTVASYRRATQAACLKAGGGPEAPLPAEARGSDRDPQAVRPRGLAGHPGARGRPGDADLCRGGPDPRRRGHAANRITRSRRSERWWDAAEVESPCLRRLPGRKRETGLRSVDALDAESGAALARSRTAGYLLSDV